jgi:hypothetical protein
VVASNQLKPNVKKALSEQMTVPATHRVVVAYQAVMMGSMQTATMVPPMMDSPLMMVGQMTVEPMAAM